MRLPFDKINRFFAQLRPSTSRIRKRYKKKFGHYPKLDPPRTFNEKVQWRKLYDRNPLMVTCGDKYAVREYIADQVGEDYLIPLLAVTDSADEIPWETLPSAFVIKATHGSGWIEMVTEKEQCDRARIEANCRKWLESNYYDSLREWNYKSIKPRLVIEAMLLTAEGSIPYDFKFHCFNGHKTCKQFVQIDIGRYEEHLRCFYDADWIKLPCTVKKPIYPGEVPQPSNADELFSLARELSAPFDYVRVDLYNVDGKIYFGELTFSPNSGMESWDPPEWDQVFGDYWIQRSDSGGK